MAAGRRHLLLVKLSDRATPSRLPRQDPSRVINGILAHHLWSQHLAPTIDARQRLAPTIDARQRFAYTIHTIHDLAYTIHVRQHFAYTIHTIHDLAHTIHTRQQLVGIIHRALRWRLLEPHPAEPRGLAEVAQRDGAVTGVPLRSLLSLRGASRLAAKRLASIAARIAECPRGGRMGVLRGAHAGVRASEAPVVMHVLRDE
ncbi:hypothetical protein T484DRAFT_1822217 [Baffinella frigidus]|nr:hypothetical protein T484DRAFT_1822217 [Cryptophyta sp. CCMP2293]